MIWKGLGNEAVPEELKPEIEGFLDHYTSDEFYAQPLITETDIDRANSLLDRILNKKRG